MLRHMQPPLSSLARNVRPGMLMRFDDETHDASVQASALPHAARVRN